MENEEEHLAILLTEYKIRLQKGDQDPIKIKK